MVADILMPPSLHITKFVKISLKTEYGSFQETSVYSRQNQMLYSAKI